MKKRCLSLALALLMCLSLLPMTALAAGPSATAQGVTVTIDKSNYEHGEKIYYGWSGVTDAHADGVLRGLVGLYAAGSAYDDEITYQYTDYESAEIDIDNDSINCFTAPTTDGNYEIRFYWGATPSESSFVLSVPFTVGNVKTGSISVAQTELTANTSIAVDYSGITAEMESANAFVGIFEPGAEHDVHEAADIDGYKQVKTGAGQLSLHTPNINGQFELRLYNTLYNLTADNLMMSVTITLTGATQEPTAQTQSGGENSDDEMPGDEKPGEDTKDKCALCGFCPEPLGLCIFIWLAIAVAIIVILIVVVLLTKKKKCPNCKTKVKKKDKNCPKCGAAINKN